jgi:hypothetical protein
VGHVGNLLLRVVDSGDNGARELLETIGKLVFLGRGLAGLLAALGLGSDATIGVEATERSVALAKDATSLLDKRLDVVDKLLLIELVTGRAISLLNVLDRC